jgi:hypothetical protein
MRKFWKEFAYLVGFVVLTFGPFKGLFLAYGLIGTAWLVVRLVRKNDGSPSVEPDMSDSRGLHGGYSSYNHRH